MKSLYIFCFVTGMAISASAGTTDLPGVANFHQVDRNLYRGAQPSDEGLKNLAALGVKTIIDLRHGTDHADTEQQEAERLGLRYINVPMEGLTPPTDKQIADLMAIFNAADQGPVFVHCREGKDRTGAVIACYRIAHDHWANDKALEEARSYGLHATQHPRQNYIMHFNSSDTGLSQTGLSQTGLTQTSVESSTGASAQPLPVA
jgi:tyrosine-protein phosphatase SIW14